MVSSDALPMLLSLICNSSFVWSYWSLFLHALFGFLYCGGARQSVFSQTVEAKNIVVTANQAEFEPTSVFTPDKVSACVVLQFYASCHAQARFVLYSKWILQNKETRISVYWKFFPSHYIHVIKKANAFLA